MLVALVAALVATGYYSSFTGQVVQWLDIDEALVSVDALRNIFKVWNAMFIASAVPIPAHTRAPHFRQTLASGCFWHARWGCP